MTHFHLACLFSVIVSEINSKSSIGNTMVFGSIIGGWNKVNFSIETAKENGLNPFTYLQYIFEKLPNMNLKDQGAMDELLPWASTLPPECRLNTKLKSNT